MNDRSILIYGPWGEYPDHPADLWKYEVINGDTRLGYWAWVTAHENNDPPGPAQSLN